MDNICENNVTGVDRVDQKEEEDIADAPLLVLC